jgi:asparagine synthase (glutamine-hydrolysing)
MTNFAGLIRFDGASVSERQEVALASALGQRQRGRVHFQRTAHAVFAQVASAGDPRTGALFAADSRLDNLGDIAATAGVSLRGGEAACMRAIFEQRGDAGLAQLLGVYAMAHWDEAGRTLTLARDCTGGRALFYHTGKGFVAFASHLGTLLALPDVPCDLDERLLANFLALNHREREATFYRGVSRVPSRTVVRISPGGITQRHYWSPQLGAAPPFTRDEDYVARGRELMDRAVARVLRDTPRVAICVSGGFDSSAVAATAARLGSAELDCYCGVPPPGLDRSVRDHRYLDESDKVRALERLHPALRLTLVAPQAAHPMQADPTRFFQTVMPMPCRNVDNLGWFSGIQDTLVRHGHRVALTGTMGNLTFSWDGRFCLSSLARQGRWLELARQARTLARGAGDSLPRTVVRQGLVPLLPPGLHRVFQRLRGREPEDVSRFSLLNPDVVQSLDLPGQWRDDGFDPTYSTRGTSAQLRAHQIFDQLQISRDQLAMQGNSLETRDPYGDRELIEFSLTIPETLFLRDGVPRWYARQLFADRLPREILEETRKGEQSPNWFESLNARRPLIEAAVERLEASPLASRLVDMPRLKQLIVDWPSDARAAEEHMPAYRLALDRAVHVGQFIRWVERGNE